MRKVYFFLTLCFIATIVKAQEDSDSKSRTQTYSISTGEMIFQWGDIGFTSEYKENNPLEEQLNSPVRFTMFFHYGRNYHIDFTNNFGVFSGFAIRNVGITSNERLVKEDGVLQDYKIIRRSYNLGVPFAFKLGAFDKHTYLFMGGEAELTFAYKEKYWDSHNRSGDKKKYTEWFGDQTNRFVFAAFAGFQFEEGFNIRFKYYFTDFLNHDYKNPNNKVRDLTRYARSNLMYISVSYQVRNDKVWKKRRKRPKPSEIETTYLD